MIKTQVAELLQKEMDRKDFLRHIGVAAAVIVGVPTLLNALTRMQSGSLQGRSQTTGYGSMPYGGDKDGQR